MTNSSIVTFRRTDVVSQCMEDAAKKIADHFKIRRTHIPDFCSMLLNSKRWNINNLSQKLNRWISMFGRLSGTQGLISIVENAFLACQNDNDIHNLRGIMLEALLIGTNGGSAILNDLNCGWGAKVYVNNNVIRYHCRSNPKPYSDCADRATVDLGIWNGNHGRFYECKVHPNSLRCKEIKYMDALSSKLQSHNISHEIFFVSADSLDEVKIKLLEMNADSSYKPIGYHELAGFLSA